MFSRISAMLLFCLALLPFACAERPQGMVKGEFDVVVDSETFKANIYIRETRQKKALKGHFNWTGMRAGIRYYITGTVTDVEIDGKVADVWVTVDSVLDAAHIRPGWTFRFRVVDGGQPGSEGDTMQLWWLTGSTAQWGPVPLVDGNLVVQANDQALSRSK